MNFKQAEIGLVPNDWYIEDLRHFLDLITYGFTNPMPDAKDGPWKLTAKDIVDGRINYVTARRTTLDAFTNKLSNKSKPKIGDVLLTKDGSIGRVAVVDKENLCINQSVALLRPNKLINPYFLKYLLSSHYYQQVMENDSDGSTIKHIYITRVDKMQVAVPPLKKQKEILEILGSLDDRIELLRKSNITIESIAQTLFKSWFIDFDPVRAKAEGREPERMDAETAALFPDSFEESELGLIPLGWKVSSLGETVTYLSRGISPKYTVNAGITVINQKCIRDNIVDLTKARTHDPAQRKIEGRELLVGDVLVNSTGVGTLGRVAQILSIDEPIIADSHVTVVRVGGLLTWNYLGLALSNRQAEIEQLGEGSTGQTELSRSMLAKLKLIIPSHDVLHAFDLSTLPLRNRFSANLKQIKTLSTLRDILLPRLISGQLKSCEYEVTA